MRDVCRKPHVTQVGIYYRLHKMCGICGWIDKQPVERAIMDSMISQLRHRGPDVQKVEVLDNVGLGHSRLSIIDLTDNASQPMHNEDKSLWLGYLLIYEGIRMVKYALAALAMKLFSMNNLSKRVYREIGNTFVAKKRKKAKIDSYIKRGKLLFSLCEKYHVVKENDKLFEIGTGWMHWYSLYIRLFYNVNMTMMDVWDNRQLEALKASFFKVYELSEGISRQKYLHDIDFIVNVDSFKKLYDKFNLNYVIEDKGSLSQFPSNYFNCIFSFHVLEHVPKEYTNDLANNIYRILKPGGFSIHQIGIDDHLSHYDKRESSMNYLRYSDTIWKIFFQNEVQYFNRLLMSDWIDIFGQEGLSLREKIPEFANIDSLQIHSKYQRYTKEDLSCENLTIVHQKPK